MFALDDLKEAHKLVQGHFAPTPQYAWPLLGQLLGSEVVVKHENHTPIGAFKVRGGLTYVDRLKRERPEIGGIISATRGNHGQSLAYAGKRAGVGVTIVVPKGNSEEKNVSMQALGAELIEHGDDFQAAADHALQLSQERNLEMVPSFHRDLVLGVATYGLELFTAHDDLDVVYVAIGQGSGICGTIIARDLLGLKTQIVGVQSENAPAHALSFQAGEKVTTETANTFADGLATRIPVDAALEVMMGGAERIMTVSDREIAAAMVHYWKATHNLAEGAGAATLAAAIREKELNHGRKVGVILSGGNIDFELFNKTVQSLQQPGLHKAGLQNLEPA